MTDKLGFVGEKMKIGIIGYGNLGKALVKGLILTGFSQNDIEINARTQKTRNSVQDEYKDIYVTDSKMELVNRTDVIILITEPKNAKEVLNEIKDYNINEKIIVSFMAGITIAEIRDMLGEKHNTVKLFRVMPNIAIQDGNGVIGVAYDEEDYEIFQNVLNVLNKLGYVLKLDEDSLNYITVTAASGLAFAACLMNSYQKASNTLINDDEKSKEITIRIFENVIDMIKREDCSFDDIICHITTKGGTTEAGMKNLNQELITENLKVCMKKSYEKAKNIM